MLNLTRGGFAARQDGFKVLQPFGASVLSLAVLPSSILYPSAKGDFNDKTLLENFNG